MTASIGIKLIKCLVLPTSATARDKRADFLIYDEQSKVAIPVGCRIKRIKSFN